MGAEERSVHLGIEGIMSSKIEARTHTERDGGTMVSLVIPADPSRFLIARSVVTAIAAQAALSIDAIEDARLAVTECCNLLCTLGRPEHLRVRMWSEASALVLEVTAEDGSAERAVDPPTHSLSWAIVSSLAETSWTPGTGGAAITMRWPALAVR